MLKLAIVYISLKFKIIMGEGREESVAEERIKKYFDAPFFKLIKIMPFVWTLSKVKNR